VVEGVSEWEKLATLQERESLKWNKKCKTVVRKCSVSKEVSEWNKLN
jgi:hypothetical protein